MKLIQLFEKTEPSRVKAIPIIDALEIIERECSKSLSKVNETPIYRGANFGFSPVYFGSTEGTSRKSANTQNYYTLIVDNHSNWKGYPKRSQSFICTLSERVALGYGEPCLVLPFDDANIGICPDYDIWTSFKKSLTKLKLNQNFNDLSTLNEFARSALMIMNSSPINTYEDVKIEFSKITYDSIIKNAEDDTSAEALRFASFYSGELAALKNFHSLFDMYVQILSPEENDFKHQKASNFSVPNHKRAELFIEGKCLFLNRNFYKNLKEIEIERVDDVLGNYPKIMNWL